MSIDLDLVKTFNDTLAMLPASVRSKIQQFWRVQGVQEHEGRLTPPLLKKPVLASRSTCASTDGVCFYFKSVLADKAPEQILKTCVAHELAHAYRAAELGPPLNEATAYGYTSHDREEETANRLMRKWGFDPAKLLVWLRENKDALDLD